MGALKYMHSNRMFGQLVFYLEACESGSMFENILPADMNIYVTTASNSYESSWGTYCPPHDIIDGVELYTCLGDLYSVNWMEDADRQAGLMNESLFDQFVYVKNRTNESHVSQWGDLDFEDEPIGDFEGAEYSRSGAFSSGTRIKKGFGSRAGNVDSRDAKLHSLYYRYLHSGTSNIRDRLEAASALITELKGRTVLDEMFYDIDRLIGSENGCSASYDLDTKWKRKLGIEKCDCCNVVYEHVRNKCGHFHLDEYALRYFRTIRRLCAMEDAMILEKVSDIVDSSCK